MDKPELITEISKLSGYTKGDTAVFLDAFTEALQSTLKRGEDVNLVNVGSWFVVTREPHKSVNPGTRVEVDVPEKSIVRYKISKNLKNALLK